MTDPRPVDLEMARLVIESRWAALAVLDGGRPAASMVGYAVESKMRGLLMFLSGLSRHTRALLAARAASLVITAPDLGAGDPQELPRITLEGEATPLGRDTREFGEAWPAYHLRFPAAGRRLMLPDFVLFRLVPSGGRFVGGFARAMDVHVDRLRGAVGYLGGEEAGGARDS